jgi:hypothetical protein
LICFEKELDIDNKLNNCLQLTGFINNVFRPQKTLKKTRVKLYNTLAFPALLYGCANWFIEARGTRRITAVEMKYMRKTAEYTCTDYKTNTETAKELNITSVLDKIQEYRRIWLQHIKQNAS